MFVDLLRSRVALEAEILILRQQINVLRRTCRKRPHLTYVVVFERHLRHVLLSYTSYYNGTRAHLSLNKDAPISRAVETAGRIICRPILGGLHHQFARI